MMLGTPANPAECCEIDHYSHATDHARLKTTSLDLLVWPPCEDCYRNIGHLVWKAIFGHHRTRRSGRKSQYKSACAASPGIRVNHSVTWALGIRHTCSAVPAYIPNCCVLHYVIAGTKMGQAIKRALLLSAFYKNFKRKNITYIEKILH